MKRTVEEIIRSVDINEPYIWRLHITSEEYAVMADYALSHANERSREAALSVIIYLAEWYKREYRSGNDSPFETETVHNSWERSGINMDKYVYVTDGGTHLWQYSIFVLGGLAIQHELGRNDKGKFLKALCRIYHGEDYTLENLDDESRATAFRRSICFKHSIYEYLRAVLNGEYSDEDEQTQALLSRIKSANDETLRSKFRLEWIVKQNSSHETMSRRLRVWLKPEEVGGGLYQYLRYDRIHLWGIAEPENLDNLYIGIRWKCGDKVVNDIDKTHPTITYSNTRSDNGFLAWGIDRYAVCKDVPTAHFTKIEIVAFDTEGNEYLTHEEPTQEWMQLWRTEPYSDEWSSRQNAQHQTAVIYTDCWQADQEPAHELRFTAKGQEPSETWRWNYITDQVTIHSDGTALTLYNRVGYDQIFTRLYHNIIRYVKGGLVCHYYIDDPDESDELDSEELPLVFCREDVMVRHFATKDAIKEAQVESESLPECVEFKMGSQFEIWNDEIQPQFGKLKLRLTEKGQQYTMEVIYLPALTETEPVRRNFDNHSIDYREFDGSVKTRTDSLILDEHPLHPVIHIYVGSDDDHTELEIYRPTLTKEIVVDGRVVRRLDDGQQLYLPYILKSRTTLCDFSRRGYQRYEFREMASICNEPNANIKAWEDGMHYQAKELDPSAPEWLHITFGDKQYDGQQNLPFYYWNYDTKTQPMAVPYDYSTEKGSIIFQSMRHTDKELSCVCPRICFGGAWALKGRNVSELQCYEVAVAYQTYFYIFEPLRKLDAHKAAERIYKPLMAKRGGKLTDEDRENLRRLAEELALRWSNINVEL